MSELKTNETTIHNKYKEFYLIQKIIGLNIGEKITILLNDVPYYEYTALFNNCHVDMTVQDKGIEMTETEKIQAEIDRLEAEKLKLSA